jgi:hypothetical protein
VIIEQDYRFPKAFILREGISDEIFITEQELNDLVITVIEQQGSQYHKPQRT